MRGPSPSPSDRQHMRDKSPKQAQIYMGSINKNTHSPLQCKLSQKRLLDALILYLSTVIHNCYDEFYICVTKLFTRNVYSVQLFLLK